MNFVEGGGYRQGNNEGQPLQQSTIFNPRIAHMTSDWGEHSMDVT